MPPKRGGVCVAINVAIIGVACNGTVKRVATRRAAMRSDKEATIVHICPADALAFALMVAGKREFVTTLRLLSTPR